MVPNCCRIITAECDVGVVARIGLPTIVIFAGDVRSSLDGLTTSRFRDFCDAAYSLSGPQHFCFISMLASSPMWKNEKLQEILVNSGRRFSNYELAGKGQADPSNSITRVHPSSTNMRMMTNLQGNLTEIREEKGGNTMWSRPDGKHPVS